MDRPQILIVDDHLLVRSMMTSLLNDSGQVQVIAACRDVVEGLAVARETAPHVVLLDLNLPTIDGVVGTSRFRALLPAVHVLIHTGTAPSRRHTAALMAGACRILTKDLDPRHLLAETVRCTQLVL